MKRILVMGCTGMLGSAVFRHLLEFSEYETFGTFRGESAKVAEANFPKERIVPWELLDDFEVLDYDYYFNAIGLIKPRSTDIEETIRVNALFPREVARAVNESGGRLIHVSTDCVFSGLHDVELNENTPTDATDAYGKTKALGEPPEAMTLRCSVIGHELQGNRSFLEWCKSEKGNEVPGYTNNYWNGITAKEYGRVAENIIRLDLWEPGVFHIHPPISVVKCDLVQMVSDQLGLELKIKRGPGPVPSYRVLSTVKELNSKLDIPTIAEMVKSL